MQSFLPLPHPPRNSTGRILQITRIHIKSSFYSVVLTVVTMQRFDCMRGTMENFLISIHISNQLQHINYKVLSKNQNYYLAARERNQNISYIHLTYKRTLHLAYLAYLSCRAAARRVI